MTQRTLLEDLELETAERPPLEDGPSLNIHEPGGVNRLAFRIARELRDVELRLSALDARLDSIEAALREGGSR